MAAILKFTNLLQMRGISSPTPIVVVLFRSLSESLHMLSSVFRFRAYLSRSHWLHERNYPVSPTNFSRARTHVPFQCGPFFSNQRISDCKFPWRVHIHSSNRFAKHLRRPWKGQLARQIV